MVPVWEVTGKMSAVSGHPRLLWILAGTGTLAPLHQGAPVAVQNQTTELSCHDQHWTSIHYIPVVHHEHRGKLGMQSA